MQLQSLVSRLALACAIGLSAASIAAFANEATDTTEIEVVVNGQAEKVSIDNLKVGETRQLYSEAGTLVTVTRTVDSLQLDIGGDKTSIPMMEVGDLSGEEIEALVVSHGDGADGKKHVVRIHHADGEHAKLEGAHHKVVVIDGEDGELSTLEADGPHVIVANGGEGKQVIVKRKVVKTDSGEK